ncbi:hypothetical protein JB92DRAFT_3101308 [Gautieria morchelliformis]|nr:hypothetical protein JB92DRAFT_3101308 [Gautieria morchelliformis]
MGLAGSNLGLSGDRDDLWPDSVGISPLPPSPQTLVLAHCQIWLVGVGWETALNTPIPSAQHKYHAAIHTSIYCGGSFKDMEWICKANFGVCSPLPPDWDLAMVGEYALSTRTPLIYSLFAVGHGQGLARLHRWHRAPASCPAKHPALKALRGGYPVRRAAAAHGSPSTLGTVCLFAATQYVRSHGGRARQARTRDEKRERECAETKEGANLERCPLQSIKSPGHPDHLK